VAIDHISFGHTGGRRAGFCRLLGLAFADAVPPVLTKATTVGVPPARALRLSARITASTLFIAPRWAVYTPVAPSRSFLLSRLCPLVHEHFVLRIPFHRGAAPACALSPLPETQHSATTAAPRAYCRCCLLYLCVNEQCNVHRTPSTPACVHLLHCTQERLCLGGLPAGLLNLSRRLRGRTYHPRTLLRWWGGRCGTACSLLHGWALPGSAHRGALVSGSAS